MTVFSKSLILDRLGRQIDDHLSLVVTPFDESALDADSLDLRLGHYFLLPRLPAEAAVDTQSNRPRSDLSVHIPLGKTLVLPAHQTVLGVTLEFIKLPYDVSGQILTKSSIARAFLVIETAPWIHPNYRGCLTLEIANVSNSAVILHPEMFIGQLVLLSVDQPNEIDGLSGAYVGPLPRSASKSDAPQALTPRAAVALRLREIYPSCSDFVIPAPFREARSQSFLLNRLLRSMRRQEYDPPIFSIRRRRGSRR